MKRKPLALIFIAFFVFLTSCSLFQFNIQSIEVNNGKIEWKNKTYSYYATIGDGWKGKQIAIIDNTALQGAFEVKSYGQDE